MNNSNKYNCGDLIVTVDYAKGSDYTGVVKGIVKNANIVYEQTITKDLPAIVDFEDK